MMDGGHSVGAPLLTLQLRRFASLRKRFVFVERNDGEF
jgi:hypothetical protein